MIDTGLIRKNILDLAIRGALTPNNSAEKKPIIPFVEDDAIQENDKLFNIPNNWDWSKIGWIMDIERGGSPRPIKAFLTNAEDGVNWIKIGDVEKNGKYILQTKEKIKPEGERKSRRVFPGDFLLTNSMSFGRPYISQIEGCVHDGWLILRNTYDLFYYDYLYYMLSSKYMFDQFSKKASGSTVDNLNIDKVASAVVPVPPIEEQIRIVKKVEEIINLLNTIDELQSAYSSNLEVLKSKIIDAGIQGKLTEQLPEDGNAEDLYAAIQEEKERLIKEKKIKKSKALPEITEEEIPFEIPNNWKWVRLVDLCKQVTDGTHKTPHYTVKGIPFLSVKDISSGFIDFSDTKFISSEEHDQLLKRCKPEKSDILFCRIGTLGKAIEIDTDIQFSIFVSLGLIKPIEKRITRYLVYVLNSGYGYGWIKLHKAGDSMHAAKINLDMLRTFPVPIPPIEEMDRIVDKVNMILDMI